jgi:hypothetical protein
MATETHRAIDAVWRIANSLATDAMRRRGQGPQHWHKLLLSQDLSFCVTGPVTRIFVAPRELVFKMFTDPKHLARFWGPTGYTSTVLEMDPRPGGTFRLEMRGPDGGIYLCKGIYREVVEPERIVYLGEPDGSQRAGADCPRTRS